MFQVKVQILKDDVVLGEATKKVAPDVFDLKAERAFQIEHSAMSVVGKAAEEAFTRYDKDNEERDSNN